MGRTDRSNDSSTDRQARQNTPIKAEVERHLALWSIGKSPSTVARISDLSRRFASLLEAQGVTRLCDATLDDCESYLWTPTRRGTAPSLHTVHLRRTSLVALFSTARETDPDHPDPTRLLDLPSKPTNTTRALNDDEIDLVRTAALGTVNRPDRLAAVIALCEATATTGELLSVQWSDVDHTNRQVRLPGADPVQARTGTLTPWGAGVLRRLHAARDSGPVITQRTAPTSTHTGQAAMVTLVSDALRGAGVNDDAVRPASIRLWAARRVLQTDGIEAAAIALGLSSLDAAAQQLDHRWQRR